MENNENKYNQALELLLSEKATKYWLIQILEILPGFKDAAVAWLDARNAEALKNQIDQISRELPPGYKIVKESGTDKTWMPGNVTWGKKREEE